MLARVIFGEQVQTSKVSSHVLHVYIYTFKRGELLFEFHARSEHQSDGRFVRET